MTNFFLKKSIYKQSKSVYIVFNKWEQPKGEKTVINLNHFTCSDQAILIEAHNILERWDVDEDFMTEDTILQAITEAASCWNRTPEDTEEMVQCLAQDFPFAD